MSEETLSPNEAQRIAALRALRILDTPREERFDRITRLAQRLFDVPITLVTLVDVNRQWFKSCIGLDMGETSRSVSFCAHAILHGDTMVIEDAQLDPRFADNPLVTGEPHIRFYAGQPLVGPNDQKLGTLCIIDRRPRQMSTDELEVLRDLATLAENELNVVRLSQELVIQRESEARVRAVMDNAADGIIAYDEHGTIESFNLAAQHLFGYDAAKVIGRNVNMLTPALGETLPDQHTPRPPGDAWAVPAERRQVVGRRKDGTTFPMDLTDSEIDLEGQRLLIAIVRNVTERKQAEEDRSRLAAIVESSDDAIIAMTPNGTILSWNTSAEKLYGYSAEEAGGQPISMLVPPDIPDEVSQILERIEPGEKAEHLETVRVARDGRRIDVAITVSPIRGSGGNVVGASAIVRDITERKRAEEELRRQAELIDLAQEAIMVLDLSTSRITFWSRGAEERYGWTKAEALGSNIHTLLRTWFPKPIEEIKAQLIDKGRWEGELVQATRDGKQIEVASRWGLLRNDRGEPLSFLEINNDITERKRVERQLRRQLNVTKTITDSLSSGILALDTGGRVTFMNPAAERMLGSTALESLGREIREIARSASGSTPEEHPLLESMRAGRTIRVDDDTFGRKDGTALPVAYTASPTFEDGRVVGSVVAFQDMTKFREVEEMKQQFISTVSHELRTPLTSIRGYLEALIEDEAGPLNEEQREYAEISYRNAKRLEMLVGDLLTVSRLDSGRLNMNVEKIEIDNILGQLKEEFRPVAEEKNLSLSIDPEPELTVSGDRLRTIQVLSNLISNALKFSPPGRNVRVGAHRSDGSIIVEVADQGVGIPASELSQLTERFFRASTAGEVQGTGLGLSISKEIVERQGGRLEIESEEGVGSTFRVVLPAAE